MSMTPGYDDSICEGLQLLRLQAEETTENEVESQGSELVPENIEVSRILHDYVRRR